MCTQKENKLMIIYTILELNYMPDVDSRRELNTEFNTTTIVALG